MIVEVEADEEGEVVAEIFLLVTPVDMIAYRIQSLEILNILIRHFVSFFPIQSNSLRS